MIMRKHEKIYTETRVHKTPAGGVKSVLFYFDDHWNPVDRDKATVVDIHEYDEDGRLIKTTIGRIERKKAIRTGRAVKWIILICFCIYCIWFFFFHK